MRAPVVENSIRDRARFGLRLNDPIAIEIVSERVRLARRLRAGKNRAVGSRAPLGDHLKPARIDARDDQQRDAVKHGERGGISRRQQIKDEVRHQLPAAKLVGVDAGRDRDDFSASIGVARANRQEHQRQTGVINADRFKHETIVERRSRSK